MRPIMVINGILLGTCFSIALSLAMVLIVFLVIGGDYPRIQAEMWPLGQNMLIFLVMTIVTAASFYALAIGHRFRHFAQVVMFVGLAGTIWHYLP